MQYAKQAALRFLLCAELTWALDSGVNTGVSSMAGKTLNKVMINSSKQDWLKLSSRLGASLGALLMGSAVLVGGILLESEHAQTVRAAAVTKMLREVSVLRARVESALNAKLYLVQSLNALVHAEPSINDVTFQQFAEELGLNIRSIRSLQLAPDGVVRYVWPLETNSKAIGHDLLADPRRKSAAELAISTRSIWLAGPFELIQGGQALAGRLPIFVAEDTEKREFWGFGTILLDIEELIEEVGLDDFARRHQVAVRGADALGEVGETFYGDAGLFNSDAILSDIKLPAGSWQIASMPSAGWSTTWPTKTRDRVLWIIAAGALSAFVYWLLRLPNSLRVAVQRAVAALGDSESRFRDAIEALPDGFAIYDAEGVLVVVNERLREQFSAVSSTAGVGSTYEDLLRTGVELGQYKFTNNEEAQHFVERQLARRSQGVSYSERQLSDGRWLFVTESTMSDGGLVVFYRDVTELKQKELQLIEEKIGAEAANRAKNEFLATISHELRTPLNAILGLLELLGDEDGLTVQQRSFIDTANSSAKQLLNILNEILDISKMEAGKLELTEAPFSLLDTLDAAVRVMRANAEAKSLRLSVEIAPALAVPLLGDAGRVRQVILNLLGNAIKFSNEGEIALRARSIEETAASMTVVIEVSDQGIGFDSDEAEGLFEPFSQLDNRSIRPHGGTGLGLAICRRIIERMNGEIRANSEPGMGSCFTIVLTLSKPDTGSTRPSEPALNVLLLEPSLAGRAICEAMLKDNKVELQSVSNRAELDMALAQAHFDVVLFDCPSVHEGRETLKAILSRHASARAVALCDGVTAMPEGAHGWLKKPVDKRRLYHLLEECRKTLAQLHS